MNRDNGRRKEYEDYINSPEWQEKRKRSFFIAGDQCEWCGSRNAKAVHHLHYTHFRRETVDDLLVLCDSCHVAFDELRERRSAGIREWKRLDAWAKKVHGKNWMKKKHPRIVYKDFVDWLNKKGHV